MIYTSAKTATGYTYPKALVPPLKLDGPSAMVISVPTEQLLVECGYIDKATRFLADPLPTLQSSQKYSDPALVNGRVVVTAVDKLQAQLLAENRQRLGYECTEHIEVALGWNRYRKENSDAGIYPAEFKTALDAVRSACIAECNRCEDDLNATPSWPVSPAVLSYEEVKGL